MTDAAGLDRRRLGAVALVSAAVLGFEISLMRVLLVAGWHHFAFLVISVALLGFGASGTALCLGRRRMLALGESGLFALAVSSAAAMPLALAVASHVPVEARIVPALLWRQVGAWVLFWAVLSVPFLLGGGALGLALMLDPDRPGAVYGANLLGGAAGALAAPAAMLVVEPAWLGAVMGGVALAGAACVARRSRRLAVLGAAAASVAAWLALDAPRVRVDPYKYASAIARLEAQGAVVRAARRLGPRGVVEAYRGGVLHDLPFLSGAGGAAPPPRLAVILADGHLAGSVLEVDAPGQAGVMDATLMAAPYDLAAAAPRVALLGEAGGNDVWLAARRGASAIDVVQPDANVVAVLRGPLRAAGGAVLDLPPVRVVIDDPRHFIEHARGPYDVIQLSAMESSAAGSGGVGGLAEDHLVTADGLRACVERLAPDGLLVVCRGIQTPPRDNLKILATVGEALRAAGAAHPADHVIVVRDFLGVCTIVRRSPWTGGRVALARAMVRDRGLTPVWFKGVEPGELNRPDELPAAPGGAGDLYHYGALRLLGDEAEARRFIDGYAFDIRWPTDDRPFFADFCRLDSLGAMRRAYGDMWLTRTELAFLFAVAALVLTAAAGAAATVAPLPWLARARGGVHAAVPGELTATVGYFAAIGLAYLLLEMVCLSRLSRLLGDPVRAAAVTIGGFLLLSGVGSLTTRLVARSQAGALRAAVAAIVVLGSAAAWGSPPVTAWLLVPLACAMGFPMAMGLKRLERRERLIPWAWGCNGFASVVAAPLAVVAAMTWDWRVPAAAAVGLYAAAGLLFGRLAPPTLDHAAPGAEEAPGKRKPIACP